MWSLFEIIWPIIKDALCSTYKWVRLTIRRPSAKPRSSEKTCYSFIYESFETLPECNPFSAKVSSTAVGLKNDVKVVIVPIIILMRNI